MRTAALKLIENPERKKKKVSQIRHDYLQDVLSFINPLKATTMPIITLCEGKENHFVCPVRELCFRYKAKANPDVQAWFAYLPYNKENERCESFLPAERTKISGSISNL